MSLLPESIKVGRCFLADGRAHPQIRQVIQVYPDGRIHHHSRN